MVLVVQVAAQMVVVVMAVVGVVGVWPCLRKSSLVTVRWTVSKQRVALMTAGWRRRRATMNRTTCHMRRRRRV